VFVVKVIGKLFPVGYELFFGQPFPEGARPCYLGQVSKCPVFGLIEVGYEGFQFC